GSFLFLLHFVGHGIMRTHTGAATSMRDSVGVSAPVLASTLKTITSLPFWLATRHHLPVGSRAKLRGTLMPLVACPAAVSLPVESSTVKTAMLLCPRLLT